MPYLDVSTVNVVLMELAPDSHRKTAQIAPKGNRFAPLIWPMSSLRTDDLLKWKALTSAQQHLSHLPLTRAGCAIKISEILVKHPADVTHMEPVGSRRCCAMRPERLPNFTHWGRDPLESYWGGLQPDVFSLIPVDLHSCPQRRDLTPLRRLPPSTSPQRGLSGLKTWFMEHVTDFYLPILFIFTDFHWAEGESGHRGRCY